MGGGKDSYIGASTPETKGFNTELPGAKLKDERALNKMSYYELASKDSDKIRLQKKQDPYAAGTRPADTATLHFPFARKPLSSLSGSNEMRGAETQVYQKLAQLQNELNKSPRTQQAARYDEPTAVSAAKASSKGNDPELQQMNSLLEKILDIQHPNRLSQQAKNEVVDTARFKAIPAIVDGNQKITQGSVVRMKLLDSMNVRGQHIPKGQLIFASGNLYNQRMTLTIKTIRIGCIILPVDLTVYDMTDGLEGISVPEAVTSEAVRDGADNGMQSMQFMSPDESIAAQTATASINAAKGLFSKKLKRVKAKLRNGHPLLLRYNKQ